MIYVVATMKIRPETKDACIAAAKVCIAGTVKEDGCVFYDLNTSVSDPSLLTFVERWTTREALAKHFDAPHLKVWREQAAKFVLERKVEIIHAGKVETL
jgi:quinol monooxygenase YgiN